MFLNAAFAIPYPSTFAFSALGAVNPTTYRRSNTLSLTKIPNNGTWIIASQTTVDYEIRE